jgi:hypothetical protein
MAADDLRQSNSKLQGLNRKIRLINHRGYGHHSAGACDALPLLQWTDRHTAHRMARPTSFGRR